MRSKVDRLVLKTMPDELPKAQIFDGRAAFLCQRVEDNAFHPIFLRRGITVAAEELDELLGTG
jgi:hypothetical protein